MHSTFGMSSPSKVCFVVSTHSKAVIYFILVTSGPKFSLVESRLEANANHKGEGLLGKVDFPHLSVELCRGEGVPNVRDKLDCEDDAAKRSEENGCKVHVDTATRTVQGVMTSGTVIRCLLYQYLINL